MLKYELVENSEEYVTYRYYPEGKAESGTITVSKKDKSILNSEFAANDKSKKYFYKLYHRRIKDFIDQGEFRERGMVAWY